MIAMQEQMIRKTQGVIGGAACVRRTRIAVWMLVGYKQLGLSDAALLEAYPTLTQQDLEAAWDYYDSNREEVDEAMRKNDEDE